MCYDLWKLTSFNTADVLIGGQFVAVFYSAGSIKMRQLDNFN